MSADVTLLVGTRKGAWIIRSDAARAKWELEGPIQLGAMCHHLVRDPRDGTLLMASSTGHLGPTVYRSNDMGKSWKEAAKPPAFAKATTAKRERAVGHVFWLTPGLASQPGTWFAGTSPQGLFKSTDGGDSWEGVAGLNDHPDLDTWTGGVQDGTPDGPKLHSVIVDPRDGDHLYVGMSSGGVFESTDGGGTWQPLNKGIAMDFAPPGEYEYGQDPHCVVMHPQNPDLLYQQNHCGIYRVTRPDTEWERIGDAMPRDVGDIGFPVVVHPRDEQTAWVFPMDGTDVWPRTSVAGKPAAYRTSDGGKSWERQDAGLPTAQAWFTVMRQAMTADAADPVGVYFGTTQGELWGSTDEGRQWSLIARHLPLIYAVEVA